MNWVGGARYRLQGSVKNDKKTQKEFFEKKRLQRRSFKPSAKVTLHNKKHQISQDVLSLKWQTLINDTEVSASHSNYRIVSLGSRKMTPPKIGINLGNMKNIENVELPVSPIDAQSVLILSSPTRQFGSKEKQENGRNKSKIDPNVTTDILPSSKIKNGSTSQPVFIDLFGGNVKMPTKIQSTDRLKQKYVAYCSREVKVPHKGCENCPAHPCFELHGRNDSMQEKDTNTVTFLGSEDLITMPDNNCNHESTTTNFFLPSSYVTCNSIDQIQEPERGNSSFNFSFNAFSKVENFSNNNDCMFPDMMPSLSSEHTESAFNSGMSFEVNMVNSPQSSKKIDSQADRGFHRLDYSYRYHRDKSLANRMDSEVQRGIALNSDTKRTSGNYKETNRINEVPQKKINCDQYCNSERDHRGSLATQISPPAADFLQCNIANPKDYTQMSEKEDLNTFLPRYKEVQNKFMRISNQRTVLANDVYLQKQEIYPVPKSKYYTPDISSHKLYKKTVSHIEKETSKASITGKNDFTKENGFSFKTSFKEKRAYNLHTRAHPVSKNEVTASSNAPMTIFSAECESAICAGHEYDDEVNSKLSDKTSTQCQQQILSQEYGGCFAFTNSSGQVNHRMKDVNCRDTQFSESPRLENSGGSVREVITYMVDLITKESQIQHSDGEEDRQNISKDSVSREETPTTVCKVIPKDRLCSPISSVDMKDQSSRRLGKTQTQRDNTTYHCATISSAVACVRADNGRIVTCNNLTGNQKAVKTYKWADKNISLAESDSKGKGFSASRCRKCVSVTSHSISVGTQTSSAICKNAFCSPVFSIHKLSDRSETIDDLLSCKYVSATCKL